MTLHGQIVLITGGTRGIGRAIALRLARERPQHLVLAYSLNHQAARQTVRDLADQGVDATAIPTDVGSEKLLKELFQEIGARFGRLDVFISNAARAAFRSTVDLSVRSWRRTLELNAEAFLLGSQMAFELMKPRRSGRIIGLSSLGATRYIPNYAGLGAAKASIECLARYLAAELAPHGVSVNVVSGGFVDTESMRIIPEYQELTEYIRSRTPAGRLAKPEDLAGVVAFLCSPEADWIRGQTIVADGGFSLQLT
jgi:enoyl-[acyl-carrier protein] reductase III